MSIIISIMTYSLIICGVILVVAYPFKILRRSASQERTREFASTEEVVRYIQLEEERLIRLKNQIVEQELLLNRLKQEIQTEAQQ